jgi:hypothetical protein
MRMGREDEELCKDAVVGYARSRAYEADARRKPDDVPRPDYFLTLDGVEYARGDGIDGFT